MASPVGALSITRVSYGADVETPPPSARLPFGQSTLQRRYLSLRMSVSARLAMYWKPLTPLAPAGPAGPAAPCSPRGPVAPLAPARPRSPLSPFAPTAPLAPAGPAGPAAPVSELTAAALSRSALIERFLMSLAVIVPSLTFAPVTVAAA